MGVLSAKIQSITGIQKRDEDEITQIWVVVCDSKLDGPITIRANAAIPKLSQSYSYGTESSPTMRCVEVNCERIGGQGDDPTIAGWAWNVTVRFSTEGTTPENPLEKPTEYEWQGEIHQIPFEKDIINERAVTNSAKQTFDPPPLKDDMRWVLTATRNEATFDANYAENYANKINSDTFQGKPPGTFKIGTPRARKQTDPVYGEYWTITYEFHYRREGWVQEILDQGRYVFDYQYSSVDGSTTGLTAVKESDGFTPVHDPILLNGKGQPNAITDKPVYLSYNAYLSIAFAGLNL